MMMILNSLIYFSIEINTRVKTAVNVKSLFHSCLLQSDGYRLHKLSLCSSR